jgi:hypothetical protein
MAYCTYQQKSFFLKKNIHMDFQYNRVQGGGTITTSKTTGRRCSCERTPGSGPTRGRRRGRLEEWRPPRLGW